MARNFKKAKMGNFRIYTNTPLIRIQRFKTYRTFMDSYYA